MLRYSADLRTLAFVVTYYLLVSLAITVPLGLFASTLLVGTLCPLSFFCAVITHNTVHVPIFRSRRLNQLFQLALTPTYGHPVSMFVPGHNLSHHKYLQTPKDRMRTDKMRFRWNLLNQLAFNFVVGPAIFRDNAAYVRTMKTRRPRWYAQFVREALFYVLFLVATAATAIASFGPLPGLARWLVFVVLPHQYAVWGIAGINFVQHDGTDGDHPYNHSRNFTGKLLNWFTFNNGYHGIHHLRPTLHWSLAPEAHARELAPHVDPRLEETSLVAYCIRAYLVPGTRMRFDGTPVVLPPVREDEPWIPGALEGGGDANKDDEYGAVA